MTLLDFVARTSLALGCGFLIGLERQLTGHVAGIRINVLVSLGTSMFVLFSIVMDAPDPTRVAAQIVPGVGFLCTGIIFKDGVNVRGLNTAATIWCTAAAGMLSASGNYLYALVATGLLLLANLALRPLADWIRPLGLFDDSEKYYNVSLTCRSEDEMRMRSLLMKGFRDASLSLVNLKSKDRDNGRIEIKSTLLCTGKRRDDQVEGLVRRVSLEEGVAKAGWEMT